MACQVVRAEYLTTATEILTQNRVRMTRGN
jgi:hypothetical protein